MGPAGGIDLAIHQAAGNPWLVERNQRNAGLKKATSEEMLAAGIKFINLFTKIPYSSPLKSENGII